MFVVSFCCFCGMVKGGGLSDLSRFSYRFESTCGRDGDAELRLSDRS
jgi:hypothetical protein